MDFDKEIERLLKRIEELLDDGKSLKEAMRIVEEALEEYNDSVRDRIEQELYSITQTLPPQSLTGPELSAALYANAKQIEAQIGKILKEHIEAKATIGELAMKLYEGYGFRDKEVLAVKKRLPKYLLKEIDRPKNIKNLIRKINRLKTLPLRAAYTKVADEIEKMESDALRKALEVAMEEKARYYAKRIAQTEIFRAKNFKWAKEYLEDEEIEFVRFEMSSYHPKVDICDFYANLDLGYGKGVVPKEQMRTLPLHPFCRCKYVPVYKDRKLKGKKLKSFKEAAKVTMQRFSDYERRQIVGSREKLEEFERGVDIELIFNRLRPKYPIKRYVDVMGYNSGMERVFEKYERNEYGYIVATISTSLAKILKSNTNEVVFSEASIKKNMRHHPDIKEDVYKRLDEIVGRTHLIVRDGERNIAVAIYMNEMYHYALKSTKSGNAIFLTSFRRTKQKDIDRLRKKAKKEKVQILKDFMP